MATRHDPSLLFTQEEGWLQLGGIQALVRLPLDQIRADRRRGLKAAMFIAGYRGSPVGGLDQALMAQDRTHRGLRQLVLRPSAPHRARRRRAAIAREHIASSARAAGPP